MARGAPFDGERRQDGVKIVGAFSEKPDSPRDAFTFGGGRQELRDAVRIGLRLQIGEAGCTAAASARSRARRRRCDPIRCARSAPVCIERSLGYRDL